ncbi:unnamed protein product [Camellia sinensis]
MEKNATKEGVCETNVGNVVTKSSSHPTSVGFVSAIEKKKTGKCGHFSIRKDWKICWPFSSLDDNQESKKLADMLPPLHVPEFRWWDCQNCVQRGDASDDAADIRLVSNKLGESSNSDVNTSTDVISSELCPMIHDHTKEMVANVMSIIRPDINTSENYNNTVVKDVDKTIKEANTCEMMDAQCVNKEATKDTETINLNLEGDGLEELVEENCGTSKSEQLEEMMLHQKPKLGTSEKEVVDSLIGGHTSKVHPLKSSEDDDDDAHGFHDQFHTDWPGDSSQILSSRKPQKFRLLTDIIKSEVSIASTKISGSDGITSSDHVNTKVTQTNYADDLDGLGLDIHSGGQVAVQENVEKDAKAKSKRRKTLQAKDQEPPSQMRWSKSVSEKIRIYERDQENNCIDSTRSYPTHNCFDSASEIANSKSVKNVFGWEGLRSDFKIRCNENRTGDGKVIQSKKKNKRTRFEESNQKSTFCLKESNILEDARDTLIPLQAGMQSQDQVIRHDDEHDQVGVGISPFRSAMDASTGIYIHPSVFSNKAARGKAVVSELQTNMALVEGDCSATYQDVNFRSTKTDIVPAKTAQKRISGRGLHASVNCRMDSERSDRESTLQNHKEEISQIGSGKEIVVKHAETTGVFLRYATNSSSERGAHSGLKNKKATHKKASTSIKQNNMSQVQDGASTIWSKELPFIDNYENNMGIQGHSEATKNQSDEIADKMSELESVNDIPIEIVELLAKNRHERRRLEAENSNKKMLCESETETTKNLKDADKNEFSGIHEDNSRYLWEKNLEMHKPQSSNARGGISAAAKSVAVEPVEETIAYSSHLKKPRKSIGSKIKHLKQSHDKGSFPFSVSSVNHSSGNQFAEASTGKNISVQSCRLEGDMLGHGWPISFLQCSSSHPIHRIVSGPTQIRGARHVSLPNVADDPLGIESSQKFANLSQSLNRNFDFERFKKMNAEQPCACTQKKIGNFPHPVISPSDLYTNETMPATQLLKLMDAGMSSRISHMSGSGSGGLGKTRESFPIDGLRVGFLSPSNSMMLPLKSHLIDGPISNGEADKMAGTEICSVNRNPADFSIPEAGNEFMRGSGYLKCRKLISKRGRPRLRMMNLQALKEPAQK